MSDYVTLTVNGQDYAGWKSVRIEAGLERVARSFELSVTDHWPGSAEQTRRIKPGDLCEVRIGDDLVCTGYVDATPINYDAGAITVMIRGRSKTADLVDCSASNSGGQFKGQKAEAIAGKLAAQYGLDVVTEVDTGAPLTDHQNQQGESAFESLDRIAKQRQLLMTDNAAGALVMASPGSGGRAQTALVLGQNVLSASAGFDYSEVYSHYQVKGQVGKGGADADWGDNSAAQAAQSFGAATDNSIKRRRVLIVRQTGQADAATCKQRAAYEQQVRAAKAGEIRYKVAGWRQADGSLWRPNQTVRVTDAIMQIDIDLLISEVIYTLDDSMLTELVVLPAGAFATEPQAKATAKSKRGGNSLAGWPD